MTFKTRNILYYLIQQWALLFPLYFVFALLLAGSCLVERFNLMLYLWPVIIYLFDYFVNNLSIELLILLHDFPLHYS